MIGCRMQKVPPVNGCPPRAVILALCLYCLSGCVPAATGEDQRAAFAPLGDAETAAVSADGAFRIVAFGDSLTAGLGLPAEEAYPARLQERLAAAGYRGRVVNAGVSGETTAGGLRRMDWALEGDIEILILALGGNDGLRGLPVDQMRENLARMIVAARGSGARVLLAGMEAPPNFGTDYADRFRSVFEQLAAEFEVAFVPFLLEGVAGIAELNQADGIHPECGGCRPRGGPHLVGARADAAGGAGAARGGHSFGRDMIELRGVSKTVRSGSRPLTILQPTDLTVASGQFSR